MKKKISNIIYFLCVGVVILLVFIIIKMGVFNGALKENIPVSVLGSDVHSVPIIR